MSPRCLDCRKVLTVQGAAFCPACYLHWLLFAAPTVEEATEIARGFAARQEVSR